MRIVEDFLNNGDKDAKEEEGDGELMGKREATELSGGSDDEFYEPGLR